MCSSDLSKSSARPEAIRAIRSAVAGAIMTRSELSATEICETALALLHKEVSTVLPERASQVVRPTKLRLDSVGMTVTRNPWSCNRRSRSHALYAAIPAPTPSRTSRPRGNSITRERDELLFWFEGFVGKEVVIYLAKSD